MGITYLGKRTSEATLVAVKVVHPDIASEAALRGTLLAARSVAYSRLGASGIYFAQLMVRMGIAAEINAKATIVEQGFAGYDFQSWYGLWAPKGTPREICQRINALMRETMAEPAIVQRLNASLLEPVVETSEESKAFIAAEVPKHVALLKQAGFEAQ